MQSISLFGIFWGLLNFANALHVYLNASSDREHRRGSSFACSFTDADLSRIFAAIRRLCDIGFVFISRNLQGGVLKFLCGLYS
jgi:hypothetical protein